MRISTLAMWIYMALCTQTCLNETIEPAIATPIATVTVGEPTFETPQAKCAQSVDDLGLDTLAAQDQRLMDDKVIIVDKSARRIMLFGDGKIRHDRTHGNDDCWRIGLGVNKRGRSTGKLDKTRQGDRRTPEGWFATSDKPWSNYHSAILIHYPDLRHAKTALDNGMIGQEMYKKIARAQESRTVPPQDTVLGGDILIHGGGSAHDWTWGCIAMNDSDIDEMRALLPKGMRAWILILP